MDPARRAGNEFMFQMMAEMNVDNMNSLGTLKVITACPHCFHTQEKNMKNMVVNTKYTTTLKFSMN